MSLQLRRTGPGRGWALGVARTTSDHLLWYRVFTVALRPSRAVPRHGLEVLSHRTPQGRESRAVQHGAVTVECQTSTGPLHLAMSADALAGLQSWLQPPPGPGKPGPPSPAALDHPSSGAPDIPGPRPVGCRPTALPSCATPRRIPPGCNPGSSRIVDTNGKRGSSADGQR